MFVVEQSQCARSSEFGALATTGPATTPQLGLRHDAGDAAETGTGVELDGGVPYTDLDTGLSLEASGRALVAQEDSKYREWGTSGVVGPSPPTSAGGASSSAWRRHTGRRFVGLGEVREVPLERPAEVAPVLRERRVLHFAFDPRAYSAMVFAVSIAVTSRVSQRGATAFRIRFVVVVSASPVLAGMPPRAATSSQSRTSERAECGCPGVARFHVIASVLVRVPDHLLVPVLSWSFRWLWRLRLATLRIAEEPPLYPRCSPNV